MTPPMRALATAVAAAALAVLAGCSASTPASAPTSPTATTASTSPPAQAAASGQRPAQLPPPGYTWEGSATQRIWVAIPRRWAALNLARLSLSQVTQRFATTGIDSAAMRADVISLKKQRALFFTDPASATASPHRFTTNASAVCQPETATGSAASTIAALKSQIRAEYAGIKARVMAETPARINGGQGFAVRVALTVTSGYQITELQVVALSSTNRVCFITFTTDNSAKFLPVFRKAAASIHVG
jgi:hypothetical protein